MDPRLLFYYLSAVVADAAPAPLVVTYSGGIDGPSIAVELD